MILLVLDKMDSFGKMKIDWIILTKTEQKGELEMSVLTLCPRCGDTGSDKTATCKYCSYVGTIPLTLEEDAKYWKLLKGEPGDTVSDCLVNTETYFNELREKYQLKQGEKCDQALWDNRQKKDENWLKKRLQEEAEYDEKRRQEKEQQAKLSWRDRNRAFGVTCPTCGSSDHVYRISAAKKGFLAGLMGAASAGLQAKTFQCKNCGYKW